MSLELTQLVGFGAGAGAPLAIFDSGNFSNAGSSGSIIYTVPAGGIPAGSTAFFVGGDGSTETITGVTDSRGNTWAVDVSGTAGVGCSIARGAIVTALQSGDTITATLSISGSNRMGRVFYATGLIASPLDKTADAGANSAGPASATTAATTQASELVIGALHLASSLTVTGGESGWTTLGTDVSIGTSFFHVVYKIVAATGAQTYAPTISGSGFWHTEVATYKAA